MRNYINFCVAKKPCKVCINKIFVKFPELWYVVGMAKKKKIKEVKNCEIGRATLSHWICFQTSTACFQEEVHHYYR